MFITIKVDWKRGWQKKKNEIQRNLLKHQNSAQFSIFLRSSSDQKTVRRQNYKFLWDIRSFILNPCKLSVIWTTGSGKRIDGVWGKLFWQRCQNRNLHVQVFFSRKVYLWGNYLISKISWILTKKTQFYAFRAFFREILFLSHLMAKSRPNSELSLVKKLIFESKDWNWNSISIICWQKNSRKISSWQQKVNVRQIWASLWWLIGIKVEWRSGGQNRKNESHRHSRNTRKQLSFHSSSVAAGIMKLTDGNILLLCGSTENSCCFRGKFWWL